MSATPARTSPMRSIPLVVVALVLAACGGSPSAVEDDPSPTAPAASSGPPALEGTWATGTIPAADIRAVVLDAGFKRRDAAKVIGGTRTFRFELQFEEGGYELTSAWDGEPVGVLEAGGYLLEEDDRLLLDTGDIGDTFLVALDLQGDRLSLELIRNTESGTAEDKYTHSYFTTAFFTGHAFTRSD